MLIGNNKISELAGRNIKMMFLVIFGLVVSIDIANARDDRPFFITEYNDLGLAVYIPAYPKWKAEVYDNVNSPMLQIRTPEKYYPPAVMQIIKHSNYKVSKEGLRDVAFSAMNTIRANSSVSPLESINRLSSYNSGMLTGFEDQFAAVTEKKEYEHKSIVAVLSSGSLVTILLTTPSGQVAHIEHMFEKMMVNLREL